MQEDQLAMALGTWSRSATRLVHHLPKADELRANAPIFPDRPLALHALVPVRRRCGLRRLAAVALRDLARSSFGRPRDRRSCTHLLLASDCIPRPGYQTKRRATLVFRAGIAAGGSG